MTAPPKRVHQKRQAPCCQPSRTHAEQAPVPVLPPAAHELTLLSEYSLPWLLCWNSAGWTLEDLYLINRRGPCSSNPGVLPVHAYSAMPAQGQCWNSAGTVLGQCRTVQEQCRKMLGQCRNSAGTVQEQCRNSAGTVQEQFRTSAGIVLEQCCSSAGTMPEQCRSRAGTVLGQRWSLADPY